MMCTSLTAGSFANDMAIVGSSLSVQAPDPATVADKGINISEKTTGLIDVGQRHRGHDPAGIKGTLTSTAPTLATNTAVIGTTDSKSLYVTGIAGQLNTNAFGPLSRHRTQTVTNSVASNNNYVQFASMGGLATSIV